MHVPWEQDDRPVWRLGCGFELDRRAREQVGAPEARRLERVLAATDAVRGPRVTLAAGQARVALLVRGVDEDEAAHRALSVLDVAARQVPRLRLGELLQRSIAPATPPAAPAVAGSSAEAC